MKYIGDGLKYFCFPVRDDKLVSASYLEEGATKVWYVCSPQGMWKFEQVVLSISLTWTI